MSEPNFDYDCEYCGEHIAHCICGEQAKKQIEEEGVGDNEIQ